MKLWCYSLHRLSTFLQNVEQNREYFEIMEISQTDHYQVNKQKNNTKDREKIRREYIVIYFL